MSDALTMPRRPLGRPTPAAQATYDAALIVWCDGIREIQSSLDFEVSSRGWCYVLEEYGLSKSDFDIAQRLLNDCRKDGHLSLDICCEDTRRAAKHLEYLHDPNPNVRAAEIVDYVNTAEEYYKPHSFWIAQDSYVEMVVEKVDLKSLFSKVCEPFHIPLTNFAGRTDLHSRAAIMKRFAYWEAEGKRCVLLYCGDHDPGGLHITNFIRSNMADMTRAVGWSPEDLLIDRFGLNADFIAQHRLTWIDNLNTGRGGSLDDPEHADHHKHYVQSYLKKFGARKVEANALVSRPEAGRELCRQAILKYLPANAPDQYQSSLELPRQQMRAEIRRLQDIDGGAS
jgi:hypothetical protein